MIYPDQFLGLAPYPLAAAPVVVMPLPLECTVSYGGGTGGGPKALLEATCQIETFDEETGVDFEVYPRVHTMAPLASSEDAAEYLRRTSERAAKLRDKFVVALGGEHLVTYGVVMGLAAHPKALTIVQIDAHADLIDELDGRRWSHGTVMRRLWDEGCRLIQIGVRSLSRAEHELTQTGERLETYFAHELPERWDELMMRLAGLTGDVYLTLDVDGLDPGVAPSTGTPQPDGLTWRQTMTILRTLTACARHRLIGADLVEFVPSPNPPGCDLVVAKILTRLLAYWAVGQGQR